jgi:hypothetical protein
MTTDGSQPDPETMAQELLGDLFVKIEQLHHQRGDRERFAVQPGSSLAGDDQATDPYQLSHAVAAAMGHSVEHLHAIRALIIDAGVMHPAAPFTIARAAIENASIAVWLLAPASRTERVMRRLRWNWVDARDGNQFGEEINSPTDLPTTQHRLNRIGAAITGDASYAHTSRATTTDIVKAADAAVDRTHVLAAWRVCAGFSHGRMWTTLSVLDRTTVPSEDDPDVLHAYVTSSLHTLWWAVSTAWRVLTRAHQLYQTRRAQHY